MTDSALSVNEIISNAIAWARTFVGSPEYAGRCLSFVEDAVESSNHIEMFGGASAGESALEYNASAQNGSPPRGAFVFYDWIGTLKGERKNWGHVGLALGDDQIIHAWDMVRIDHYRAVEQLVSADGAAPAYLGWVPPARYLQGFKIRRTN